MFRALCLSSVGGANFDAACGDHRQCANKLIKRAETAGESVVHMMRRALVLGCWNGPECCALAVGLFRR